MSESIESIVIAYHQQSELIHKSIHLIESITFTNVPAILQYSIQTRSDFETQLFNLHRIIPWESTISTEDDMTMWLLSNESLNRNAVLRYLITPNEYVSAVLENVCVKICSLEVGHHFADGLKLFMPIVGAWDSKTDDFNLTYERKNLFYLLNHYVFEHLKHSKTPIFLTGVQNVEILSEFAFLILELLQNIKLKKQPPAFLMSEFFTAARNVLSNSSDGLHLSMKELNELYMKLSSSKTLTPITSSFNSNLSSCLLSQIILADIIAISFHLETTFQNYFGILTRDAIYLIDCNHPTSPSTGLSSISICIPLVNNQVCYCDSISANSVLEISSINGNKLPYIRFPALILSDATTSRRLYHSNPPVEEVTYHDTLYIGTPTTLSDTNTETTRNTFSHLIYSPIGIKSKIEVWLSEIELLCWNCNANT